MVNIEGLKILDSVIKELKEEGDMTSCEYVGLCDPKHITGTRQSTLAFWKHEYIEQTTGHMGDDYYGHLYIPIGKSNDYYLHFSYTA